MAASVDVSEVRAFAAALDAEGRATERAVKGVVTKGAVNIKDQMRAEMSRSRHFGQIASTISFDVRTVGAFGGGVVEAEIGPNRHFRAARLANIAYFGTSRGGGTVPDPQGALDAEEPRFVAALSALLGHSL